MAGLTGWHLLILLAVVVLLFGAKRLPDMARAIGQSTRILKGEMKDTTDNHTPTPHQPSAPSPAIEQPQPSATPAQPDTTHSRTP